MVPEPVGSTHLRFGDARVVMGIVCGYRRLFGVLDEIPDVMRSYGMVRGEGRYIGPRVLESGSVPRVPGYGQHDPKVFRGPRQVLQGLMGQGEG